MKQFDTSLPEVKLIEPRIFSDSRGFFFENWNSNRYCEMGISDPFVQDNISFSKQNVIRGLHFQHPNDQGKLISVLEGEIFDVAVDIRPNSSHFKKWIGFNLSSTNHRQLWIPKGFAHGFAVLSSTALVSYKTTQYYSPKDELTLRWDDPTVNVSWPIETPILSDKDLSGKQLNQFCDTMLPKL